jgi:hypothetical protein
MITLKNIIGSNVTRNPALGGSFKKILSLIASIKDNLNELSEKEILINLDSIAEEIKNLKKIFRVYKWSTSEKLLIKYPTKNYFTRVDNCIAKKLDSIDLEYQFNMTEAIEELYKTWEIMSSFKIVEQNSDYILNILYEIYLNLEQHYLYHYDNLKKK